MRKRLIFIVVAVVAFSMMFMTSCGKSEFGASDSSEKGMTITAQKASSGDFFLTGSLVVGEQERVAVTGNLESGSVRIELIAAPEEQSIDEVPELDGEAAIEFNVSADDIQFVYMDPGSYMVRATVTEKATGTVQIDVQPIE